MKTKKRTMKSNHNTTKKNGGSNGDIPCGINEKGEKIKCPPNHRCEKMEDGTEKCKKSVDIELKYDDDSITLQVPWKRHEKWLSYIDILNRYIPQIRTLIGDRKMTISKLKQTNDNLKINIRNEELTQQFKSANNKEELIIQNILLTNIYHETLKDNNKINTIKTTKKITIQKPNNVKTDDNNIIQEENKEKEKTVEEEFNEKFSVESKEKNDDELEKSDFTKKIEDLQNNIGINPGKDNEKENQEFLFQSEKKNHDFLKENNNNYDFLYPELDDPNFNLKIAKKQEFFDTQYDGTIHDIKEYSEKMCHSDFELMPHQLFVRNFMSVQTPYNSLLLYHGLGTGKTCSAIGISEEMRRFIKNIGSNQKIFIIASPNVQNNFKLQLFDERKLKLEEGIWNLNTCVGNELLKEINPVQIQNIPKSKVISQINRLIKVHYQFFGYGEFANYIKKQTMIDEELNYTPKEKKHMEIQKIKKIFNNHLIIIDEVHNISSVQTNKDNKKTSILLKNVCKYAENLRLLLLSATPMYNNFREIIFITNLLNLVDNRAEIREEDVFDKEGNFIEEKKTEDGRIIEGGKELLVRKLTGYISYVRGENPFTFPYRIYPDIYDESKLLKSDEYPSLQMNKKPIEDKIKFTPIYTNSMGIYQSEVYKFIMNNIRNNTFSTSINKDEKNMPNFDNMESFGYTLLSSPIQCLNIVYPHEKFESIIEASNTELEIDDTEINVTEADEINIEENQELISSMLGSNGLSNIMTYEKINTPYMLRHNFEYKKESLEKYGPIFSQENLNNYSNKIYNICNIIKNSTGIIMIYSQYLDSGIVPMALALESIGFTRFGTASHTRPLFKTSQSEPIDSLTLKKKSEFLKENLPFNQAKYVMITGDKYFSPNNSADLKEITNENNKNGENIKVVLITKAAAEGLDFKNIRQLHIMEPWYNSSRTEQITGRCVRNLSHCSLPFEKRNVEIYLHATLPKNDEETADLYIYRYAEKKAVQIGKVSRLLKEISVDCLLNIEQTNLTIENINAKTNGKEIQIELSSKPDVEKITYQVGDRPFTALCDYMDTCTYVCNPNVDLKTIETFKNTYNEQFAKMNYPNIIKRIRQLYREQNFYKRDDLMKLINQGKSFPIEHIDYTLSYLVNSKNEHILDKFGRYGHLINKDIYYVFQPFEITDEYASLYDREKIIPNKHETIEMELPIEKNTSQENLKSTMENLTDKYKEITQYLKENMNVLNEEVKNRQNMKEELSKLKKINKQELSEIRKKYNLTNSTNWFKNVGIVYDKLTEYFGISPELIEKFSVYHFLDQLDLESHKSLVKKLYFENTNEDLPYFSHIFSYYQAQVLQVSNLKSIILPNFNKSILFILNEDEQNLIEARPTDYIKFKSDMVRKFQIPDAKINLIFGFMSASKNEYVFKIKNLNNDKNNTGTSCEKIGKVDIIRRLKPLITENPHNIKDWPEFDSNMLQEFSKSNLCSLFECIVRFYNESKKDKYWYLNTTLALSNDVTKKNIIKLI